MHLNSGVLIRLDALWIMRLNTVQDTYRDDVRWRQRAYAKTLWWKFAWKYRGKNEFLNQTTTDMWYIAHALNNGHYEKTGMPHQVC